MPDKPPHKKSLSRTAIARHWARYMPLPLLLMVLAWVVSDAVNVYLVSDDIQWVVRTVADGHRPWNIFIEPLFGSYYRPMAHLMWLVNYYLWGFNFFAYHVMFLGLWLGVIALAYAVGSRLAGWMGGLAVGALLGFNDIFLVMASWKSWYTSLVEMAAVLGWAFFYLGWLKGRRRRDLILWILCAVMGLLSRELTPLILSSCILVTWVIEPVRRTVWRRLLLWAIITMAVLLSLPAYRSVIFASASGASGSASMPGSTSTISDAPSISAAYVPHRLHSHTFSMLTYGLSPYLLLFAVLTGAARAWRLPSKWPRHWHWAVMAALAIGLGLLALLGDVFIVGMILLPLFIVVAMRGDQQDRMLAAWFVAAYTPILFLAHASNAYHMLAFTALALYTGKQVARFVSKEVFPLLNRGGPRISFKGAGLARHAMAILFMLVFVAQASILILNAQHARTLIARRALRGAKARSEVAAAISGVLANPAPDHKVWVGGGDYADLAALILRETQGFNPRRLSAKQVGLRLFESRLSVYTDALVYDEGLFKKYNTFPNSGFETFRYGMPRGTLAHTGRWALKMQGLPPPNEATVRIMDSGRFKLRPDIGYLFGGFLRCDRASGASLWMELRSRPASYICRTGMASGDSGEWQLVWACASPPAGAGIMALGELGATSHVTGAAYADDIFLCPVAPLIQEARQRRNNMAGEEQGGDSNPSYR